MDRSGQQLRYSNGIISSVALKSESKIGYCDMYRRKNACLCMTVKDNKNEFGTLPECSGMCTKQNINIYIENYETRINDEKFNLKCDSASLDTYPYYKTVKSESKISAINNLPIYIGRNLQKSKSIYTEWGDPLNKTDNVRNWESTKNCSNLTYYPYINSGRQYITEGTSCIKNQIENKTSINHVQVNISPGVENSVLYNEINKKYICRGSIAKDKRVLNNVPMQNAPRIASGPMSSSTCNNLYVAPPYFTVDKFVNQEQSDTRQQSTQSSLFRSRNFYNNPMMPTNIGETRESLLISNKEQLIGIKVLESPNIPLMRLETSMESNVLDMRDQHRHLPIKKEICNYEKGCISTKIENIHENDAYSGDINRRNDFIQNKNPITFSIDQYNGPDSVELENQNLYAIADFSATYNTHGSSTQNIAFHDVQYAQYQRNPTQEPCAKNPCSNLIPPSTKNIIRETRKPNYRELINHVHALRSATSEDDLNMEIIKRTLNYNQQPKDIPNTPIPRKLSTKNFRRNEVAMFSKTQRSNMFDETYKKSSLKSNITSPLDLSVKTIKTKADSTENCSNCKVMLTENGYPPKFNFRPDFSENRNFVANIDSKITETNGPISNTLDKNRRTSEDLPNRIVVNEPSHFNNSCNRAAIDLNLKRTVVGCRSENACVLQTTTPKINSNNACSLQNCKSPNIMQDYAGRENAEGTDIKLVALKRTIPFDKDDGSELLHKKMCLENVYHSDLENCALNEYSKSSEIGSKAPINTSETSSDRDTVAFALNGNIEQTLTKANKHDILNDVFITKNEIVTKFEPMVIEQRPDPIETKQDVSSIIAARIRTKAELKGFTFQEDEGIYNRKPLLNMENFYCNYDNIPSVQMDEDLGAWENACNDFVDQLIMNCKNSISEIKESKLFEHEIIPSLKNMQSSDNKNDFLYNDVHKSNDIVGFKEVPLTDSFLLNETTSSNFDAKEIVDKIRNDSVLKENTDLSDYKIQNNKSYLLFEENEQKDAANHTNNNEVYQNCMQKDSSCRVSNLALTEYVTRNKNKEEQVLKNNSKAIDITKISVVRLKREKYASKRCSLGDNNIKYKVINDTSNQVNNKTEEELTVNRNANKKRSFPSITKSTLRRKNVSLECDRRRQSNVKTHIENGDLKCNTITTRLRYQRLQLQNKTEHTEKNNQINKSKKKKIKLHCYQKSNERELSNDPDKLYLEVYRYKRALKIPPNLITIRSPCTERMSASLPDLDLNLQNNLLTKEILRSNTDGKVEDVPKSIIDVLHSRVVKSKCQAKSNPKHFKNEHQHTSKLVMQQFNNEKLNFEPLNSCGNNSHSYKEHRNVFETQVLTSRTRMEYKMQLNKEVIREIFGGSERPASAPPEINNVKTDLDIAFKNRYNTCFQQIDFDTDTNIENKIHGELHKNRRSYIHDNLDESNYVISSNVKEKANEIDKSVMSNKYKRKRSGRPYRRKFSSGFDYLRKRKKSNTHALYNYSHLKSTVENYIEANIQFKSEKDVCREIQKWVLNKGVGQSALHKAARLGYIDVIVYCLEKMGLNPDHKDNAGYTPLHDACVNGSLEIARVLLQYGANHSEGAHSGIRPLHEASENGHIEIVRMLLSYGADPLLETYSGQTPLMLASDPEMNDFIQMHLFDVQVNAISRKSWIFPGPWKLLDDAENGYNAFSDVSLLDGKINFKNKHYVCTDFHYFQDMKPNFVGNVNGMKLLSNQNRSIKNDVCEFEIFVDATDAEGELFEFEEANMPLPPLYLLKDEGMEKWVLLSDLCSLLKVKSKDTMLNKIFPSISPATVSRAYVRELKMCDFLEKATCLQLLCAGEKINICHSKVVLIQYNENVRKLLGVKTIFMKF